MKQIKNNLIQKEISKNTLGRNCNSLERIRLTLRRTRDTLGRIRGTFPVWFQIQMGGMGETHGSVRSTSVPNPTGSQMIPGSNKQKR